MLRQEADAEAARRNADPTAPDGLWVARRDDAGDWHVVRLSVPGMAATRPTGAHVESKPKPPEADDPRPSIFQNVPPYGAA